MSGIAVQYRIQFPILIRYPVLPKSHLLAYINNVQCPFCPYCSRIQYTPSPSLEIILPVKMFVLFGYPFRGVNIGNLPLLLIDSVRVLCKHVHHINIINVIIGNNGR